MKNDWGESVRQHLAEKHGITQARHNVGKGQSVNLGSAIFRVFRDELIEEFIVNGRRPNHRDPENK